VDALFMAWMRQCWQQAAEYLAQNGTDSPPDTVAAACPATFGDLAIAVWAMEQNRRVTP
ncbi:MAG: hypothetical protein GWN58_25555, partial [Anaerolineae bacterium]|nr:hypothetical protein [Anaerolineae bacterium]